VTLRCDHRRSAYAKPARVKLDAERKAGAILAEQVRGELAAIPDQTWAGHGSRS